MIHIPTQLKRFQENHIQKVFVPKLTAMALTQFLKVLQSCGRRTLTYLSQVTQLTLQDSSIEAGKKYFSVASGGGTGRTLHPDNMAAGPASYGMTDTLGRMHSDAQFAGSSSVPAHVEMMGLIGAGNNPMVGMTVAVAVSIEEAATAGKF